MLFLALEMSESDLRGSSDRQKLQELILYFQRRGRLPEIVTACRRIRPDLFSEGTSVPPAGKAAVSATPVTLPKPAAQNVVFTAETLSQIRPSILHNLLAIFLSDEEIGRLGTALDIDYGVVTGKTKPSRVGTFIQQAEAGQKLPELLKAGYQLRPEVPWQNAYDPHRATSTLSRRCDTRAVYNLLLDALEDNVTLLAFCRTYIPGVVSSLALPSSLRRNAHELIRYFSRRSAVEELLALVEAFYPQKHAAYEPYEPQETPAERRQRQQAEAQAAARAERQRQDKMVPPGLRLRQTLRHPRPGSQEEQWFTRLAWSLDGRLLLAVSATAIYVLDGESGALVAQKPYAAPEPVVALLANGRHALLAEQQTLSLWELQSGETLFTVRGQAGDIKTLAVTPDGKWAVSGSVAPQLKVWNLAQREESHLLPGHEHGITQVLFTPDGKYLLSSSLDRTIKVWQWPNERVLHTLQDGKHGSKCMALAADGRTLASISSYNSAILLWQIEKGRLLRIGAGQQKSVHALTYSAGGHFLATRARGYQLHLWRCEPWELVASFVQTGVPGKPGNNCAFHPRKPILAVTGEEGRVIRLWQLDADKR